MKHLFLLLLFFSISKLVTAQHASDSLINTSQLPKSNTVCSIYLKDGQVVKGTINNITDSNLQVSIAADSMVGNYQNILISTIEKIKIRRNAFWEGMGIGAVSGGLVGYGAGYISYSSNPDISQSDNGDNQRTRAFVGALIGAVPGAVVGNIVGSISIKRNFNIDGKKENIDKMIQTLWKLP